MAEPIEEPSISDVIVLSTSQKAKTVKQTPNASLRATTIEDRRLHYIQNEMDRLLRGFVGRAQVTKDEWAAFLNVVTAISDMIPAEEDKACAEHDNDVTSVMHYPHELSDDERYAFHHFS